MCHLVVNRQFVGEFGGFDMQWTELCAGRTLHIVDTAPLDPGVQRLLLQFFQFSSVLGHTVIPDEFVHWTPESHPDTILLLHAIAPDDTDAILNVAAAGVPVAVATSTFTRSDERDAMERTLREAGILIYPKTASWVTEGLQGLITNRDGFPTVRE